MNSFRPGLPPSLLGPPHDDAIPIGTFGTVTLDGKDYYIMVPNLEIRSGFDELELDCGRQKVINRCDHCQRGDWVPDIAHSFDEAIEKGWLVPVDTFERWTEGKR